MTMDQPASGFGDFAGYSNDSFPSASPPIASDSDVDWSVFENAERYLLRDDSAWITRLSKDFWWNLERISEMMTSDMNPNNGTFNRSTTQKFPQAYQQTKSFPQQMQTAAQQQPPPMNFAGVPPRKIVGQRTQQPYRTNPMFNNGFASPPPSSGSSSSSSGSTIVRPTNMNIPDKSNFFQAFSSMSIHSSTNDQDNNIYNPFESKISFDNNMWANNSQQPILWQ